MINQEAAEGADLRLDPEGERVKPMKTLRVGGGALLLAGAMTYVGRGVPNGLAGVITFTVSDVLVAAAILVVAIGFTKEESLTRRSGMGLVGAIGGAAMVIFLAVVIYPPFNALFPTVPAFYFLSHFIAIIMVAIVWAEVWRAGVLRSPWRIIPGVALALYALSWAVGQFFAAPTSAMPDAVMLVAGVFFQLARFLSTVGMGAVLVFLSFRPQTTEVFTSSHPEST